MHGTADKAITMDQFANLTVELEQAGVKHELVTYSGAPHALTVFGSKRVTVKTRRPASWALFNDFLKRKLN